MKPANPLKSVVFIQAEIKTESEDEESDTQRKIMHIETDQEKSERTFIKYETSLLPGENDQKSEKKLTNVKQNKKLNKTGNANSMYELDDINIVEDANGQWTCNKCGLKYVNRTRLIYHMRRSHSVLTNFKFKCEHCGLEYAKLDGLKKHIKRKHEARKYDVNTSNVKYTCKYCGSVYGFKQSLYRHMKFKHLLIDPTESLQACTFCPATFTQRYCLLHHIKKKHTSDEVFCNECGMKFSGKIELINHINAMHNNIKSDLVIDKTDFLNNEIINIDDSNGIKWYKESFLSNGRKQCNFCEQTLSNINRMKYHIKTKHSDYFAKLKQTIDEMESISKKFDCIICGKKYKNMVTLRFHVKLKHSVEVTNNKSFTCEYCGLLFMSRTTLVYHLKKKHIGLESEETKEKYQVVLVEVEKECLEKKLTGDITASEELVRVKKTTVEKRYQCDLCDHTCKNLQSIKHHKIARHTNEKNLIIKCPHCEYATKFKQYLQKHISVKHSSPNALEHRIMYVCEVCGYRTQFKYRFRRHLDTHHELKIACEFCNHVSNSRKSLAAHRKTHSGGC